MGAGKTSWHETLASRASGRLPINEERRSDHELQEDGSFVLKARSASHHGTIDWQFTSRQARIKLKQFYPVVKAPLD